MFHVGMKKAHTQTDRERTDKEERERDRERQTDRQTERETESTRVTEEDYNTFNLIFF